MSKSVSSDEFWAYLQREYFYRFPKATHDEAMAFLMRFTEVSKNSTKRAQQSLKNCSKKNAKGEKDGDA